MVEPGAEMVCHGDQALGVLDHGQRSPPDADPVVPGERVDPWTITDNAASHAVLGQARGAAGVRS